MAAAKRKIGEQGPSEGGTVKKKTALSPVTTSKQRNIQRNLHIINKKTTSPNLLQQRCKAKQTKF